MKVRGYDKEGNELWSLEYKEDSLSRGLLYGHDILGPGGVAPLVFKAYKIVRADGFVIKDRDGNPGRYE